MHLELVKRLKKDVLINCSTNSQTMQLFQSLWLCKLLHQGTLNRYFLSGVTHHLSFCYGRYVWNQMIKIHIDQQISIIIANDQYND